MKVLLKFYNTFKVRLNQFSITPSKLYKISKYIIMKKVKFLSLLAIIGLMSFTTGPRDWKFIGDKIANFSIDRDVLYVTGNDIYTKIKLHVTDAPLNMHDMDIYFENGDKQNVGLKNNFAQGDWSRVIDLPGNQRRIKKIEFVYDTKNVGRGKARIAVWGKR